ncbi:MAG: peptidylprolyl isomerase [Terriglobales bacterium]
MAKTRGILLLPLLALFSAGCMLQPHRPLLRAPQHDPIAPALYTVRFNTTQGPFVIEVHRAWAPLGADRFYYLTRHGFYNGCAFFRVLPGFVVQWGINPDPKIAASWKNADIPDDPVTQSNTLGMITYATSGPNTRATQVYINYGNNSGLDKMGFAPFGKVIVGMDVVDKLYSGYGEGAPRGKGPSQDLIQKQGAAYLSKDFPRLDRILSTQVKPVSNRGGRAALHRGQNRREGLRNSEWASVPASAPGETSRRGPSEAQRRVGAKGPQPNASISGASGAAALGPAPTI